MSWVTTSVPTYRRVMELDQTRISHDERDQVLMALSEHFETGRLHSFEYEDRRGRATDATVRSELDTLLSDLPSSDAAPLRTETDREVLGQPGSPTTQKERSPFGHLGRCLSAGTYSWLPLLATALFFLTRQWVWFLMIPAAGFLASSGSRCAPRSETRGAREPREAQSSAAMSTPGSERPSQKGR